MIIKKKKLDSLILTTGVGLALAAFILQFRANRLSQEANELTWKGNVIVEESYKLQLWDDCHDRQVSMAIQGVL